MAIRGRPERHRRQRLPGPAADGGGVLGVDVEDLEGDVAPAPPAHLRIRRRFGRLFEEDQAVPGLEHPGPRLGQLQHLAIEPPVRLEVPNRQHDADLRHPILAGRDQGDAIAVWIGHRPPRAHALAGDQQLAIAGGRGRRQRFGMGVDLEDAAGDHVPVLVLAAPDLQHVVERDAGLALPERQQRRDGVGRQPDVRLRLGQPHAARSRPQPPCFCDPK
jgi:hypothetical protein